MFRSSPIKNTHYPDLQMSVANGMIAFPNQCGTIRLFEARTLKEHIQKNTVQDNIINFIRICISEYTTKPIYDFKSSPINREPGSPAFTPKCFLTDDNMFYNRMNNGHQEIVKCGY